MNNPFNKARSIAITLLNQQSARTHEVIKKAVNWAIQMTDDMGIGKVDPEALLAQLMHEWNVFVPDSSLMTDPAGHEEWLSSRRGSLEWKFWNRYKIFLEQEKQFPEKVVDSLGHLTDEILGRLEAPDRRPPWDCRGMVVGSVQSGKTANYCGLICKAIDSGYRLIVVLAGMHDNLRSQTQYRIDEGVLGRDSQKDRQLDRADSLIGVGKLFGETLPVHTLTSSLSNGDFSAPRADTGVSIGSDPVILVVKKNGSVLRNLLKWVLHVSGQEIPEDKRKIVRNVPLLVIDDEADNASINTKDRSGRENDAESVTAINGHIRQLLNAFEKSAYVGYTATPFANIFINPDAETNRHGEDLFPRSFILNVSPPSNYVSPVRVFGLDGDPDSGIDSKQELPLCRIVEDHEAVFPLKHKKDLTVKDLPQSLIMAIHCFLLACAARRARGQVNVHNSMLVHVTRFIDVQNQVTQLVQHQVDTIRRRLAIGEGDRKITLRGQLKELWDTEFKPTSASVRQMMEEENLPDVTWEQIWAELPETAARIEVREINGHATDALDYVTHKQGFYVIAVGGDKLSRGLTLEGLSISYFLRASQMYDTLMQMGRWFGYRPGYLDLCRLFTTEELRRWYRHIALAELELRREFDRMNAAGLTPRRYGLRVREHPDGLLVTAMNKMSYAQTQQLSYAGQLVQTSHFATDLSIVHKNREIVSQFLSALGGKESAIGGKEETIERRPAWLWKDIPPQILLDTLLEDFSISEEGWRFQKQELMKFISRQAANGELNKWTIALINTNTARHLTTFGNCTVGSATRTPAKSSWDKDRVPSVYTTPNSNILSPEHQAIDLHEIKLDEDLLKALLTKRVMKDGNSLFSQDEALILRECCSEQTTLAVAGERLTRKRQFPNEGRNRQVRVNGGVARNLRPKTHGLLLIYPIVPGPDYWDEQEPFMGLAFSFPSSDTARSVEYRVSKVWQTMFRDEDYED